jgi:hypothetical protein
LSDWEEIEALLEKYLGIESKRKKKPALVDDTDLFASMIIRYPPNSNPPRPEALP